MNLIHKTIDTGITNQLGKISDAVLVEANHQLLITSGTPGLKKNGTISSDFKEQAEQVWQNVLSALEKAEMNVENIVKVTQYFKHHDDIKIYAPIKTKYLGNVSPASMSLITPGFIRDEFLFEIEVIAAKKNQS